MEIPDGSYDYAMASGFLHHLDNEQVEHVLRMMDRVATRGVIISDMLRCRRLYYAMSFLFSSANPMFRHDALATIRQAFTRHEIIALRDRAGLHYARYHRQFGHRFIIAGEKSLAKHSVFEPVGAAAGAR
jgi:ubiquinone/menaquinone biosynthesis C-methylase UbiE